MSLKTVCRECLPAKPGRGSRVKSRNLTSSNFQDRPNCDNATRHTGLEKELEQGIETEEANIQMGEACHQYIGKLTSPIHIPISQGDYGIDVLKRIRLMNSKKPK